MKKPILCLDFDGVIHSYTSGWKGATEIPDDQVPGAIEFIRQASVPFEVMIYSSRSHHTGGIDAMRLWFAKHGLGMPLSAFPHSKPPAFLTLDDRALTFLGEFPTIDALLKFKPWWANQ
jgi:hypothetical protein